MNPPHENEIDWTATTWEGSRRSQLEYWAQLSLDDIFAAQAEMAEFARRMGALGNDDKLPACLPPKGER